MAKYGSFNGNLTESENRDSLDTDNAKASNAMKRTIVTSYGRTEMKAGPYYGYVLKKITITKGKQNSSIFDIFGDSKEKITAYKVRIPEIDAFVPEPTTSPDSSDNNAHLSIELHSTYFYPEGDEIEVGTKVLVQRDNTDAEKNTILEVFKDQVEAPADPPGPKNCYKGGKGSGGTGGQANRNPELGADLNELEKWNAYTKNSGNPLNIDIVTKRINGQLITFSRTTMVKYEQFIDLWNKRRKEIKDAGMGDVGEIKYKWGEALRIWGGFYKDGDKNKNPFGWGQFRSNTKAKYDTAKQHISKQRGTHTGGNAVDINIARFSKRSDIKGNREYVRNYHDLVVHCAQLCGFTRFGVGSASTLHMDTGYRANGEYAQPYWWCYRYPDGTCYTSDLKKRHIKDGFLTDKWTTAASSRWTAPPNLKDLDYLSRRYSPS